MVKPPDYRGELPTQMVNDLSACLFASVAEVRLRLPAGVRGGPYTDILSQCTRIQLASRGDKLLSQRGCPIRNALQFVVDAQSRRLHCQAKCWSSWH